MRLPDPTGTVRALRLTWVAATAALALLRGAATLPAQETAPGVKARTVVLVPPFENQTKYHDFINYEVSGNAPDRPRRAFRVDRYSEAPRSLLEDAVQHIPGVAVVERQRVDALLVEAEFGALSGLVDADKAVKLGRMLGANRVVMGTLVDVREEVKQFQGYGIRTKGTEVQCRLRVRLLDIGAGTIPFSKVVRGSKILNESTFGKTSSSDRVFAAVEDALEALRDDADFRAALGGDAAAADALVEIEFAPTPANCDVEIDGKYVGGSPLKRKLQAGREYRVRLSKGGFASWEGVIVPEAGLKITRELDRKP